MDGAQNEINAEYERAKQYARESARELHDAMAEAGAAWAQLISQLQPQGRQN